MLLLVLSVVLCLVSAVVEDSPDLQPSRYDNELKILSSLLTKECPDYIQQKREVTDSKDQDLELKASHLQHLKQQLLKCRQDKLVSTTSRNTADVTGPAPLCPSYDGDSVFYMQSISYNNPTNGKAAGALCGTDGSPCNLFLEICVSAIKSSSCEFYHHVIDVVEEKSKSSISDNFGNLINPVEINLGNRKWQGAHVHITVLKRTPAQSLKVYRKVEEFSYDVTDVQGSSPRFVTLQGEFATNKTELVMMFTVLCLLPTTTLPTTTTSAPVPAECLTAKNLTQPWRTDRKENAIKGGGPHSYDDWACDLYHMGWFRFSGAAGTHMLDRCPYRGNCGTKYPIWSDETPPQAVGVAANITAYQVNGGNCRYAKLPMQVMRCSPSTDHDLIYNYIGRYIWVTERCTSAFCGMN